MEVEWICVHGIAGPECERCQRTRAEAERRQGDERAMRFDHLLSEIEISASQILHGVEPDIPAAMVLMEMNVNEAARIALEVSREALDKTVISLKHPLPEDTEIDEVMPP